MGLYKVDETTADLTLVAGLPAAGDVMDFKYINVTLSDLTSASGWTAPYAGIMMINIPGNKTNAVGAFYVNGTLVSLNGTSENLYRGSTFAVPKGGVVTVADMYGSNNFYAVFAYVTGNAVVNESIIEELHYNNRVNTNVRMFITSSQVHTFTATKTGFLKAYMHKSNGGYTARLFVNGVAVDQLSCYGEDSSGTVLPWIASGGIDATLSSFVKAGDVIKIDSDESGSASTNSWYLYATVLQYKS